MIRKTYWNVRLRGKKLYYRFQGYEGLANPLELIPIPPSKIELIIPTREFEKTIPQYGIMCGSWDQRAYLFQDNVIYNQFLSHFKEGVPWKETNRYYEVLERLQSGEQIGCLDINKQSVEKYNDYLEYIEILYKMIKREGYKTQAELSSGDDFLQRRPSILNEVTVFVGRNGELICKSGKHRVTISQLLDIEQIPVRIGLRHKEWQSVREEIVSAEQQSDLSNETLALLDHPDLQDILPEDWTETERGPDD